MMLPSSRKRQWASLLSTCMATATSTLASSEGLAGDDDTSHRSADNCGYSGALRMVTRIISPRDPEFHSKSGKAAIDAKVSDLRAEFVWD